MACKITAKRLEGHVILNFPDVRVPLVDCQDMHDHYPDTFEAPEFRQIVCSAIIGNYAKLGCGNERFWCKIICVFDEGLDDSLSFLGIVENYLINDDHGLMCGDIVYFKSCNIFDICDPETSDRCFNL